MWCFKCKAVGPYIFAVARFGEHDFKTGNWVRVLFVVNDQLCISSNKTNKSVKPSLTLRLIALQVRTC